jgi:hypothetical protein
LLTIIFFEGSPAPNSGFAQVALFLSNEAFVYIWKFVVAMGLFVKIRHLRKCREPLAAMAF